MLPLSLAVMLLELRLLHLFVCACVHMLHGESVTGTELSDCL